MHKDLRKVVILLAHPNIKESQANKALKHVKIKYINFKNLKMGKY